jgi:UDP-N-acetylmuramoylalanine--D-glutamate ligase
VRPGFDLTNKRVLVVGLARTGIASAIFCAGYGARVTATDELPEDRLRDAAEKLRAAGVTLALGGHRPEIFTEQDLIVVSPGVPARIAPLELARARGVAVWSEIELAWRFLRGRLIAITGSNGKTTTTALVAHILKTAGIPTLVGGNIGTPLLAVVESSTDSSVTVAEVSSFQLETIDAFRPDIGVLLNITPDHLDRHHTLAEYARAKMRMFEQQIERDAAILNADDPEVSQRQPARPHVYWFSRQKRVASGAFLQDGQIIFRHDGVEDALVRRSDIPLRGEHNVENVLAAGIAARLAGAEPEAIARGVQTFPGVEHRIEFVAEIGGVKFYNDSKATNVDAALKAVAAFDSPLLVILGGTDKGSPYTPLRDALRDRGRGALLIGAAADKIAADFGDAVPFLRADTLDRAVTMAFERAKPGDVVLLAPACSSFDQFQNYEDRGRTFKRLVGELAERNAPRNDRAAATTRGNAS